MKDKLLASLDIQSLYTNIPILKKDIGILKRLLGKN